MEECRRGKTRLCFCSSHRFQGQDMQSLIRLVVVSLTICRPHVFGVSHTVTIISPHLADWAVSDIILIGFSMQQMNRYGSNIWRSSISPLHYNPQSLSLPVTSTTNRARAFQCSVWIIPINLFIWNRNRSKCQNGCYCCYFCVNNNSRL